MKIEELYEKTEQKSLEIRIQVPDYVLASGKRQHNRRNVTPKISFSNNIPKSLQRSEKRKKDTTCNMKVDQLNKHEETSFLLDSETNQAILANAVSKEELCKFLTPLKFIEIDTWRREVPYGLTNESDADRRKWRTPLEILCGESVDSKSSTPLNIKQNVVLQNINKRDGSPVKVGRRQAAFSAPLRYNGNMKSKTPVTGGDDTRHYKVENPKSNIRPSTSVDHSQLLDNLNGERLLNLRQRSYTSATLRSKPIDSLAATRGYSSLDDVTRSAKQRLPTTISVLRASGEISPCRGNLSELAEPASPANNPKNSDITVIYNFKKNHQRNFYNKPSNRKSILDDVTRNLAAPATVRPRTRGDKTTLPFPNQENASSIRPHTRPKNLEGLNSGSNPYMDPNIAYVPQGKLSGNHKVRNYYIAAQGGPPPSTHIKSSEAMKDEIASKQSPKEKGALSYAKNYKIERPNTTYSSPWVAQTFSDLNGLSKHHDRDGYYARKPNKTVTFRIGDRRPTTHNPLSIPANGNENISMVVVNVDQACAKTDQNNNSVYQARSEKISTRGLHERANHFGTSLTIPVRQ